MENRTSSKEDDSWKLGGQAAWGPYCLGNAGDGEQLCGLDLSRLCFAACSGHRRAGLGHRGGEPFPVATPLRDPSGCLHDAFLWNGPPGSACNHSCFCAQFTCGPRIKESTIRSCYKL